MRFDGKAVLIMGGGNGLGAEMVTAFAKEEASVVINDIHAEPAERIAQRIRKLGQKATCVIGDICDVDLVQKLAHTTIAEFGSIDILINSAGEFSSKKATEEQNDIDEWQRIVDVHLRGSYLCSKTA